MLIGDSHLGGIRRNLFNNSLTKYNVTSNYSVVLKKYMERYIDNQKLKFTVYL